jgi:hypothetical protein
MLVEVVKEFEPEMVKSYENVVSLEREKALKAGVKFIKFSPADGKAYVDLAWKAGYEEAKQICRPQHFEKLMKMAGW